MRTYHSKLLEGLVREAVQLGADAVEVEYRDGFEEVVAYRGAVGRQVARLQGGTADATALRRELYACKARPRRISVDGGVLLLRAEVWDSFGEDAFRISLGQPNRALRPPRGDQLKSDSPRVRRPCR